MTTVAEQLIRRFKERGIRFVFGVPSGSWLYYMEAMRKEGVEFVLVSNEASAGFMADVCSRLTGVPGVCYGTVGPGATNLSTGVVNAFLDRSSVIALTSEPPEKLIGRTVQMAIDHQALFRPITKWTTRLTADRIDQVLAPGTADRHRRGSRSRAYRPARGSRAHARSPTRPRRTPRPAADRLHRPRGRIRSLPPWKRYSAASRNQCWPSVSPRSVPESVPSWHRLAEKHRMPVVLTPMAKGMLSGRPPLVCRRPVPRPERPRRRDAPAGRPRGSRRLRPGGVQLRGLDARGAPAAPGYGRG